jgi:hypothetical protein
VEHWTSDHRGEAIIFGKVDRSTGATNVATGNVAPATATNIASWDSQVKQIEGMLFVICISM